MAFFWSARWYWGRCQAASRNISFLFLLFTPSYPRGRYRGRVPVSASSPHTAACTRWGRPGWSWPGSPCRNPCELDYDILREHWPGQVALGAAQSPEGLIGHGRPHCIGFLYPSRHVKYGQEAIIMIWGAIHWNLDEVTDLDFIHSITRRSI